MKTYATFGLTGSLVGALMTLVLFFLGWHGEQLVMTTKWFVWLPMMLIGIGVSVTLIALAMRNVREESADKGLSYGRGLGVGVLVGLWQGLGGAVFQVLYMTVINPSFHDAMIDFQVQQMQEKGTPHEAIEMAKKVMNITTGVPMQAVFQVLGAVFFAFIISLIVAAFLKREPQGAPPVLPAA